MNISRARLWPPGQSRLRMLGWASVIGLVLVALLAPASPALSNDTPGNNGTVKIHEGAGENDPGEVRNEPHVCTFHLHFYFSDPEQAGTWEIQEWSPGDKGTVVLSGTYDTHGDGEDRQPEEGVYTLPNGHYKLFWDGDLDTQKHDKMKVFWVDCPETTTTSSTTTGTETTGTETTTTGTETSTSATGTVSGTTTSSSTSTGTETSTSGTETSTSGTETSTSGTETSTTFTGTVSGTTTTATTTGTETSTTGTETSTTGTETSTTTSFSQNVSGTTTSAGPTQPNTATVQSPSSGSGGNQASLLAAVLAFLVGGFLLLTPPRREQREDRG